MLSESSHRPESGEEEKKTLWVGDIQPWMDENYLASLFNKAAQITSVKVVRDRQSNLPLGYGFVEFADHESAARVLNLYTGTKNPATGKLYRLNWGFFGGASGPNSRPPPPNPNSQNYGPPSERPSSGNAYSAGMSARRLQRLSDNLTSV